MSSWADQVVCHAAGNSCCGGMGSVLINQPNPDRVGDLREGSDHGTETEEGDQCDCSPQEPPPPQGPGIQGGEDTSVGYMIIFIH